MADSSDFIVRFWGVRGSVACADEQTRAYGGDTSCVEMRCGSHLLIFDAGTGLRRLGNAIAGQGPIDADLFLSHTHYDHIGGLPFFSPAFCATNRFQLWAGPQEVEGSIEATLRQFMKSPLFPVPLDILTAKIEFHDFAAETVLEPRPGITVRTAPLNHPNGATGFRVEYGGRAVCYVTDTEHTPGSPDANVLGLIAGADYVIYDATYTDEEFDRYVGWGHSTWQEGVRLVRAAGAKTLVLFHHDPNHSDTKIDGIVEEAQRALPGTLAARQDMTLTV